MEATMENQFGNLLYRSQRQMLDAIAESWLSADGNNTDADQRRFLDTTSAAELAAECIDGWGLNRAVGGGDSDDENPPHMDQQDYTAGDLAAAFGRLRGALTAA